MDEIQLSGTRCRNDATSRFDDGPVQQPARAPGQLLIGQPARLSTLPEQVGG
jgi:hypothetical protein